MNKKENKAWVSLEDLDTKKDSFDAQNEEFNHTQEAENSNPTRRDFLKYAGFGLGAATVASCDIPVKKAIPYVIKPEEIVPGVATFYASAIVQGGDVIPALIKTREGRPIKVEGNPGTESKKTFTAGGTSARTQAAVLELYDTNRLKAPAKVVDGSANTITWAELDESVLAGLKGAASIRIVSHTNNSPTFNKAIEQFIVAYPNAKFIQYDPFSSAATLEANAKMYGKSNLPNYNFGAAKCIVGVEADFLGTWVSPVEFTNGYTKNRKVSDKSVKSAEKDMSRHIQFESRMSLTGSNADHRVLIKPSEWQAAMGLLYTEVAALTNNTGSSLSFQPTFAWAKATKAIKSTAKNLVANAGKSLVVCGINDVNIQMIVNAINEMVQAYGNTISWEGYSKAKLGSDKDLKALLKEMEAGTVDAMIICDGANPAYDIPSYAAGFKAGLEKINLTVSLGLTLDETSSSCKFVAPAHHNLESWGDAEPKAGHYFLVQPTISPLFKTRQAGASVLAWAGAELNNESGYYDFLKENWLTNLFVQQSAYMTKQAFWNNSLHDGWFSTKVEATAESVLELDNEEDTIATGTTTNVASALGALSQTNSVGLEVTYYESIQLGSGQFANNPWLQEMPDPVMRTTWDNFITIPIKWDRGSGYETLNDLKDGDLATVTVNGTDYTLPVFRLFGQMQDTVSIALGYGRTKAGKAGSFVGKDLFPEVKEFKYASTTASLSEKVGKDDLYACVQMHHTYGLTTTDEETGATKTYKLKTGKEKPFNVDEHVEGFQGALVNRSVFFQSNSTDLVEEVDILAKKREGYQYLNSKGLYPEHEVYKMGHHWGMAIDLSTCTGCGACTVACMAENNVPVVGKFEVNKVHEMTWLRIDRYFYGDEETPHAVYMPMMCQHCDNAPCENVCPVAATNHSSEGINQMTYNRCVGTRYCANNCPFKVRRFNWLDYTSADLFPANEVDMNRGKEEGHEDYTYMTDNLTRMVLNPDVTVRTRGVIEKCSFCIQRIQEGKLAAKIEGRKLEASDVTPACSQACPTDGIVFGDQNDKEGDLWEIMNTKRAYIALEETNVRSSVTYLMKVTNRDENFTA